MNRGSGRVRTKRWKANGKTNELFLLSGSGLIRTTLPFRLISFLSGGGGGGRTSVKAGELALIGEGTYTVVLYIYKYFVLSPKEREKPTFKFFA